MAESASPTPQQKSHNKPAEPTASQQNGVAGGVGAALPGLQHGFPNQRGLPPATVLALQRTIGNQATSQMVQRAVKIGTDDPVSTVDEFAAAYGANVRDMGTAAPAKSKARGLVNVIASNPLVGAAKMAILLGIRAIVTAAPPARNFTVFNDLMDAAITDKTAEVGAVHDAVKQTARDARAASVAVLDKAYTDKIALHNDERAKLSRLVNAGAVQTVDKPFQNACEAILSGHMTLYAATRMPHPELYTAIVNFVFPDETATVPEFVHSHLGDRANKTQRDTDMGLLNTRATEAAKKDTDQSNVPLFPAGGGALIDPVFTGGAYRATTTQNKAAFVALGDGDLDHTSFDTGGFWLGGTNTITFMLHKSLDGDRAGTEMDDGTVQGVIRHESQHFFDRHEDLPPAALGYTSANAAELEKAFTTYVTEFRAHTVEGIGSDQSATDTENEAITPKNAPDVPHADGPTAYTWKKRQLAVFKQIFDHYEDIAAAWDADEALASGARRFQLRVVAYDQFESINPTNSERVDNLFLAVKAVPAATALYDPPATTTINPALSAMLTAAGRLTGPEKTATAANASMVAAFNKYLSAEVRAHLVTVLQS